jgi:hypothetical protein
MTVSISGTGGVTFNDNSVQDTAATGFGFKNRIINGAMVIDQRNAGASVTPTDGQYTLDRWTFYLSQASKLTAQQSATVPAGFKNSLLVTSSSAYSVGSGEQFTLTQPIEGLNVYDLAWGTASAKTITLSFQVYCSLTGTFGGSIRNNGTDRSYPFSYSIPVANTWTSISITITGDTSGTWLTTNGVGMFVGFSLGAGSTVSTTAGAWVAGHYKGVTGQVNVVGTSGATFYITGVQLEKGSTATSFDYRPYGTELALCQRYFYRRTSLVAGGVISVLQAYSTTAAFGNIANLPVTMRATPTASVSAVGDFNLATSNSSNAAFTAINLDSTTKDNIATGSVSGSSGLVAGNATCFTSANSTGYINASAEL